MPKVKQNINSSSNVEQLRKVKQIVKQNNNIAGVPGGIRTHDPLLRRWNQRNRAIRAALFLLSIARGWNILSLNR